MFRSDTKITKPTNQIW